MKTFAAKMRLIEIQALDLGAHRAVNDQNALAAALLSAVDASSWRAESVSGAGSEDQFICIPLKRYALT